MKKSEIIERVMGYIKTTSENDTGRYGKAFELAVKMFLNGNRGNSKKVSAKGKTDVKFHGNTIEIKSNCGEINDNIESNRYVVYTMDNSTDYITPWQAHVLTVAQFKNLFEELGLVRIKKTTSGYKTKAIQSYKNSKRKSAALALALASYPTVEEWVAAF